jgi:CRISPR-associated protein Cas1
MKKLLNVLYILTEGAYIHVDGETVAVMNGQTTMGRFPAHILEGIACFGNTTVSTPLIALCGECGISMAFFGDNGRFMGRIEGPTRGNVLLRTNQYRVCADDNNCTLARSMALAKIANSRTLLLRSAREADDARQGQEDELREAAAKLASIAGRLTEGVSKDTIRGLEGAAGQSYFSVFDAMLRSKSSVFRFELRSKRPPQNPVNALLSFLYALLANDYRSALEGVGLDPFVGFLHTMRPGRPALALDLMEELRSPLCDRLAISLINLKSIQENCFQFMPTGVLLNDKGRREAIDAWQKRKRESIQHPFLNEEVQIGLIPHLQAQLLARHLRGDLEDYPPFLWR